MADNKKKPKKTGFSLQGFDVQSYKQTEKYVQAIDLLYNQAVQEFATLAGKVSVNPDKPFSFSDYPQTQVKAQQIISGLASKMQGVIIKGSRDQWLYACKKNDEFLNHILNTAKIPKKQLAKFQDRNLDALDAFQKRKTAGMDLSKRIWNYTGQMKTQMELGIDIAVGEGKSAAQLSRDLRKYLVDPDKLFHKVRDKHGNLVLSKNAAAFHPGQGKYRSSYKNAMRLTRSEINMAYRQSDQLRWQQLDFVVGYEIKLSNNHTTLVNGVPTPFKDICDELAGKYPKWFKWTAWHPQCRCHVVPILRSREETNADELSELQAAFKGTEYKKFESKDLVRDVPDNFKQWVADKQEASKGWNSAPYWVKDNFNGGLLTQGLKVAPIAPKQVQKAIKTPEQKAAIQKAWNNRILRKKYTSELNAIDNKWYEVPSIMDLKYKTGNEILNGTDPKVVDAMMAKLRHKIEVKNAWDAGKEERNLSTLLDNVKQHRQQFSLEELKTVHKAVETKLASWESMSLPDKMKKAKFEIQFVEDNKKYSTWKVAQDAYKKYLKKVEYQLQKKNIADSIADSLTYAATTKSDSIKQMAAELQSMLDKDAPILSMFDKATALNNVVNKWIKHNAARRAKTASKKLSNGTSVDWSDQAMYSKARKDAALWAKSASEADPHVRDVAGAVWRAATNDEKTAAYRYTAGSSYINEPLRGQYYSGQYSGKYNSQKDIDHLTDLIGRSTYDFDMWIQRGVRHDSPQGIFGVDLYSMSVAQARKMLVGKEGIEPGFSSCATAKGSGFADRPVIYNIYCPKGTKMLYSEPFSAFGHGAKMKWDGISKQYDFGYEAEMLLHRSTKFRVLKVEKGDKWYIDLEIIGQL